MRKKGNENEQRAMDADKREKKSVLDVRDMLLAIFLLSTKQTIQFLLSLHITTLLSPVLVSCLFCICFHFFIFYISFNFLFLSL